ncbi:hypothetical protein GUITHDRAFT_63592 [Guillardia theta CCMP2712]|uniref:N-acetyltransferase domain-containing protein n=1 Tax=Guillardia theta (strain CCMP2712) TaxID=905079 RepID=L1K1D9_GUITC|nr:hypothetical protein GUITHDRAFT_63592 [Guillardia theta CCMP2712]EKX54412.1 hypothetical protein GUITHDRAFT_63592 [Guillardia theta CCMP2712]|eukprot:XP_005841392.1 hypothetical protein GUITHDRAFT_63592 [Guillardia theta CCMP2712]
MQGHDAERGHAILECCQAQVEDLDQILQLDTQAYNGKSLWPRSIYESELNSTNNEIFVLKFPENGEIVGFACCSLVLDECSITNIVVSKNHLRKGFASQLLSYMLDFGNSKGVRQWYLEVRAETNPAAVALYKKFGFESVGRRKHYYSNPREDALILQRGLDLSQIS